MKLLFTLSILICLSNSISGQSLFNLTLQQEQSDHISDVIEHDGRFYFIQNRLENEESVFDIDSYSDLLITTEDGSVLDQINLNGSGTNYQRIIKVANDDIYLLGFTRSDECQSTMIISTFNIQSQTLSHISSYQLCDHRIAYLNIVKGLGEKILIEEFYNPNQVYGYFRNSVFEIDPSYSIVAVPEDLADWQNVSIDFSGKGYISSQADYCNFFTANYTYRKQRYSNEQLDGDHQTHTPFGNHLILENALKSVADPDGGVQVRLIDSMLHIRKNVAILPPHSFLGGIDLPLHGGISIRNENEIWSTTVYGKNYLDNNNTFFSLTKLDSNLVVQCQEFIGYNSRYDIHGIRTLESGGGIVFGQRIRLGFGEDDKDIFAYRFGGNCELPTSTAVDKDPGFATITAFPNPAVNDLTFSAEGFDPSLLLVEIVDQVGRVLFAQKDLTGSIAVPELVTGQYFYRIRKDDKVLAVGAWVKQ